MAEDAYTGLNFASFQRKATPKVNAVKPLTIPHKDKPDKEDWFMVRKYVHYLATFYTGKRADDGERMVMVTPDVADLIEEGLKKDVIIREAYVAGVGTLLINENELKPFEADGYNTSRKAAYTAAEEQYVRMVTDRANSRYTFSVRVAPAEPPVWSDKDIIELVAASFKANIIYDVNHPIIKNLRGE